MRSASGIMAAGGALLALGVGLGAYSAHGAAPGLTAAELAALDTALNYHLVHGLGLVILGLARKAWPSGALLPLAAWLLLAGIALFSGGIYARTLLGLVPPAPLVPIGGTCFLLGWSVFTLAAWRMR